MARRRMIDPGIWQSEDFSKLSSFSKLVFIGLFSLADDEGRGKAKAVFIKSSVFPYDDKLRVTDIETSLSEIAKHMSITFYTHNGNEYYALNSWTAFQRVDHPTPSKIPAPTEIRESFGNCSEKTAPSIKEVKEDICAKTCANSFADFWKVYPKKKSKGDAEKAFKAINPNSQLLGAIIAAVEEQKLSRDWTKDNGQFIPYPATWLRAKGWEDEGPDEIGVKWREL